MSSSTIVIRADSNEIIGSGHIIRSILLGAELNKMGFHIHFLCREISDLMQAEILHHDYTFSIIRSDDDIIEYLKISIGRVSMLIIDSDDKKYYSSKFQKSIRETGSKLMFITFFNDNHFYADVVLNQNIMAETQTYSVEDYTKLMLGTRYLIMDPRFNMLSSEENLVPFEEKRNIFMVTFGNAKPDERVGMTLAALLNLDIKPDKIIIVTRATLKKEFDKFSSKGILLERYSFTDRMPYLISEAKFGINSGGLTVWEFASQNALNIIISNTKREILSSEFLNRNQLAHYLGMVSELDEDKLRKKLNDIIFSSKINKEITENLHNKINTKGSELVAQEIKNTIDGN